MRCLLMKRKAFKFNSIYRLFNKGYSLIFYKFEVKMARNPADFRVSPVNVCQNVTAKGLQCPRWAAWPPTLCA